MTQLAFHDYDKLDPPSGALRETEAIVRQDLERGGGAIAWLNGRAVGCLRFEPQDGHLHVRRLAVDPVHQRQGIGGALMLWAHAYAQDSGFHEIRIGVRPDLVSNVRFYERLGYRLIAEHRHPGYNRTTWVEMSLAL